jgi:hypothetical protein
MCVVATHIQITCAVATHIKLQLFLMLLEEIEQSDVFEYHISTNFLTPNYSNFFQVAKIESSIFASRDFHIDQSSDPAVRLMKEQLDQLLRVDLG